MKGYAERCEGELALVHVQATLNAYAWHQPRKMPTLDSLLKGKSAKASGGDVPTREEGVENARRWIALLGGAAPVTSNPPRSSRRRNSSPSD